MGILDKCLENHYTFCNELSLHFTKSKCAFVRQCRIAFRICDAVKIKLTLGASACSGVGRRHTSQATTSDCCAPRERREQVVQAVRSHSAQRSASGLSVVAHHVRSQTYTVVYYRRKILLTKGMMKNYCFHSQFIFVYFFYTRNMYEILDIGQNFFKLQPLWTHFFRISNV